MASIPGGEPPNLDCSRVSPFAGRTEGGLGRSAGLTTPKGANRLATVGCHPLEASSAVTQRVRNLSMGEYFRRKYDRTPRPLAFDASTPEEFEAWKSEFQGVVTRCLEPFPTPSIRTPR